MRSGARPSASQRRQATARGAARPSQGRRPAGRSRTRPAGDRRRGGAPRQPRYWLRWLLVIAVGVAVLAAVSYGILAGALWARDTIREQDAQQAADSAVTVYPHPVACATEDLDVALSVPTTTSVGAGLVADVTVTNAGDEACLVDAGSQSLAAVITSGGVDQWSSLTCPAEPAERRLLIDAGESASTTLTWDGSRSTGECLPAAEAQETAPVAEPTSAEETAEDGAEGEAAEAEADPRVATAGTYVVHLELGGEVVTGDHVVVVE